MSDSSLDLEASLKAASLAKWASLIAKSAVDIRSFKVFNSALYLSMVFFK
jgi:hypothetical protein